MTQPVAIVTGAASGMGLALTKHLTSQGWKVGMADVNTKAGQEQSSLLGPNTLFRTIDITDYRAQAIFFRDIFSWGERRLDLLAANAGIGDDGSFFNKQQRLDPDDLPVRPDTRTLDVNLHAVFEGIYLFRHFHAKSNTPIPTRGNIIITASSTGFYPFTPYPLYTASKHALIGLTRSCGPNLRRENISVNAICPSFVETGLSAPILEHWPKEQYLPMERVIDAFRTFLEDDEGKYFGQTLEISNGGQYFRKQIEYPDEASWMVHEELPRKLARAARERKKKAKGEGKL